MPLITGDKAIEEGGIFWLSRRPIKQNGQKSSFGTPAPATPGGTTQGHPGPTGAAHRLELTEHGQAHAAYVAHVDALAVAEAGAPHVDGALGGFGHAVPGPTPRQKQRSHNLVWEAGGRGWVWIGG